MGASILDRLNERNGTTDHTIAGALKSYIIRNGGDPTGLQNIADLVAALPEGGGSGGAKVYTITGTDHNNSVVPEGFPTSFSVNDVENGDVGLMLVLREVYQKDETDEPRETVQVHWFSERNEALDFVFGQAYNISTGNLGCMSVMSWNRNLGTCKLTQWHDGWTDSETDNYSYYDYLFGDEFVHNEMGDEYYRNTQEAEMSGEEFVLYNHSVTWKLVVFDNRSA